MDKDLLAVVYDQFNDRSKYTGGYRENRSQYQQSMNDGQSEGTFLSSQYEKECK